MYYLVYCPLWLVSLLPLRVLYVFSDIVYGFLYYVFRYRRDVVRNNLSIAFPEMAEAARREVEKKFYRNLTDTFIESIKFITISKKEILRRSTGEYEMINQLIDNGKNVHIMAGHQFNWEFANLLYSLNLRIPFVGIYMMIANKYLNRIFYNFRKQYGTILISAQEFKEKRFDVFQQQYCLALAADQNPGDPGNAYWMPFFGKMAPFVTGPAKGAVKNNTAVVIVGFQKVKRGHYAFTTEMLAEEGSLHSPEELTLRYKTALEKIIRKDPSNYLWSHRRWKWEWSPSCNTITA